MKKLIPLVIFQLLMFQYGYSQQHNKFNPELDKFCKNATNGFNAIPRERKIILYDMAKELWKKKFVVFACKTNSRRTQMLQVWAQTAFYYYGLFDKHAFSLGDTVTAVYQGVGEILSESGFYCATMLNDSSGRLLVCVNKDYPEDILSSKNFVGTIDSSRGILVNICSDDEPRGIAANKTRIHLPYISPSGFEKTKEEKQKYAELNQQIATEMLYMALKIKEIIENTY